MITFLSLIFHMLKNHMAILPSKPDIEYKMEKIKNGYMPILCAKYYMEPGT